MTRYYIRRLLGERADVLGLSVGDTDDSQAFADQLARLESLATTKLAEIDLIVRMHQTLSRNGQTYNSYLANLEGKLFALMGLVPKSAEPVSEITLPLQDAAAEDTAATPAPKAVTLAEVLEHFNNVGNVAQKYLGKMIVANYWRGTRPYSSWFADFGVNSEGQVFCQSYQSTRDIYLSEEQLEHLDGWLTAFVNQCQRILPQFKKQLQKSGVPEKVLA
ncbi:hypothetical protein RYO59_001433 [Thermosynechococcaceae cyanobacterium Okahandja]